MLLQAQYMLPGDSRGAETAGQGLAAAFCLQTQLGNIFDPKQGCFFVRPALQAAGKGSGCQAHGGSWPEPGLRPCGCITASRGCSLGQQDRAERPELSYHTCHGAPCLEADESLDSRRRGAQAGAPNQGQQPDLRHRPLKTCCRRHSFS